MNAVEKLVLWLCSRLIPRGRRADWLEEWRAELWALTHPRDRGAPAPALERLLFVAGAPAHALTERLDGWTLADLGRDFREALRRFRQAPAFALGAILIIGLAVSANTAIFSVVNATLLRTPPGIADASRLVQVGRGKSSGAFDALSYPAFADLRAHADAFEAMAAFDQDQFTLNDGADPRMIPGHIVSAGYFTLLGVSLPLGTDFTIEDERAGAASVVISDAYWRRRFGASVDVLGETIAVNARRVRIVGVAPRDFVGHAVAGPKPELWVPLGFTAYQSNARLTSRNLSWLWAVGRLRPGVSIVEARDGTQAVYDAIERAHPGTMGPRLLVVPGVGLRPNERVEARTIVVLLTASVMLVLVIASANVAGLLLARTAARRQEIAIRLALGAARFRLVRESVAESLLTALAASALAVAVNAWTTAGVRRLMPYDLAVDFGSDRYVVAFTAAAAIATGLFIGLLSGLRAGRTDVMSAVRLTSANRPGRLATVLAVVQVALSFVLIAGAVVLTRSLANVDHAARALNLDGVFAASLDLGMAGWDAERSATFIAATGRALRDRPGLTAVGFARRLPVADAQSSRSVSAEPLGFSENEVRRAAVANAVDAGFFDALGIPVIRGRAFDIRDRQGAEPVAIVSARLARELWNDSDPVGRQIHFGLDSARVVGVTRDAPARTLREASAPVVYLALAQHPASDVTIVVKGTGISPDTIRSIVRELAPGVPLARMAPLRTLVRRSMGPTELTATLFGLYGATTLLLAATAVYVLVAQATRQQRRELGIKLAIGWSPARLQGAVVGGAVRMAAAGIAIGTAITVAAGRLLEQFVLGVAPVDPVSLAAVAVGLLGMAAAAAWGPARQAASLDPVAALKAD